MNGADNLAMLGRVMGGLVVVLVLIGLAARVARRARGLKGTSGLRVIDRIGLTREANLTVIAVANRVLLLGVTAQGVTMLADLDAATARDADHASNPSSSAGPAGPARSADWPNPDPAPDPGDDSERAVWAARVQTLANTERAVKDRVPADTESRSQRRPIPSGVALEEYPDLASALRAAGRTAGSSPAKSTSSQAMPTASSATAAAPNVAPIAVEWPAAAEWGAAPEWAEPAVPRTRVEARAEARARASAEAQTSAQAQASAEATPGTGLATSTSGEVARMPTQRSATESGTKRVVVPRPTGQASGSVLSPRTWRQGIEALRDLTVRRG